MSFLTGDERRQLKLQHKIERDKRVCDRIKAVILYDKGWSVQAISEALLLTDDTIRMHLNEYIVFKKLKPQNGGSFEKLSAEQAKALDLHLKEHTYLYVKDIVEYVKFTFKVTYTIHGMRNWLQRHNFSYKKPAITPGKANKIQQQNWIEKYFELKSNLLNDETICFIDGVHPTHNVQTACGWIKKGVRKEIPSNTGRSRLNLSGSIDMLSHNIVIHEDQTLNADSTIAFFEKIEKAYPTKRVIHIFCDNARYYKNIDVKMFLEKSKIKLHFLPPYSPNLNPIERLWKWMKERIFYNTYYEHFEDLKSAIFGFFNVLSQASPDSILLKELKRRVRDKFRAISSPLADS